MITPWDLDGFGVLNVQTNLMWHAKHRAALRGFALSRRMLSSGTSRTSQDIAGESIKMAPRLEHGTLHMAAHGVWIIGSFKNMGH